MKSTDISVTIEWAAVQFTDASPGLSVIYRYHGARVGDRVEHVIPVADLMRFNPPLSIWQLIEFGCAPALEVQERMAAAEAKRERKQASRIARPTLDEAIAFMDKADVPRGIVGKVAPQALLDKLLRPDDGKLN